MLQKASQGRRDTKTCLILPFLDNIPLLPPPLPVSTLLREGQPLALLVSSNPWFEGFSFKRNNLYEIILKLCRMLLLQFCRSGALLGFDFMKVVTGWFVRSGGLRCLGCMNTASMVQVLLPCSNRQMAGTFLCRLNSEITTLKSTTGASCLGFALPKGVSVPALSPSAVGL